MTHRNADDHDLSALESRLRAERPSLNPIELDSIKQRAMEAASTPSTFARNRKAPILKSRLAITFILATGLLMSGTGATLAVTGIAGDGPAAVSQYKAPAAAPNTGDVLGVEENSGTDDATGPGTGTEDDSGVAGDQQSSDDAASAGDQVAAGDDSLPFTGLVVFPLLIGGVALLTGGTMLRRRA